MVPGVVVDVCRVTVTCPLCCHGDVYRYRYVVVKVTCTCVPMLLQGEAQKIERLMEVSRSDSSCTCVRH